MTKNNFEQIGFKLNLKTMNLFMFEAFMNLVLFMYQ